MLLSLAIMNRTSYLSYKPAPHKEYNAIIIGYVLLVFLVVMILLLTSRCMQAKSFQRDIEAAVSYHERNSEQKETHV